MIELALKSLSATNFAPFADKIEFTTQVDRSKKEFIENTFAIGDETLNKVSFIYGSNGSGKTFFCRILEEIKRLLILSPFTIAANSPLLASPFLKGFDRSTPIFLLDTVYKEQPTSFSLDVMLGKTMYHYEFSIKGKEVVYELLTKKYRRTEVLMERLSSSHSDISVRSDFKGFESYKSTVKKDALCLAIADTLNNTLAGDLVTAINGINVLNMATPRVQPPDPQRSLSKKRLDKYVNVLKKSVPTLRHLEVSVKEENIKRSSESDGFEDRELITKKTTIAVESGHALYNNGSEEAVQPLDFFNDESMGTIKLFTLLPHLYDVLEYGGVLILDEIENGLHLSLAKDIIKLFMDPESNPHNAQLICTTHQPLLIDNHTRRDQVWILSKNELGKSEIHRMSNMSTSRAKVNLTNRLLEGAFGCNPKPYFL